MLATWRGGMTGDAVKELVAAASCCCKQKAGAGGACDANAALETWPNHLIAMCCGLEARELATQCLQHGVAAYQRRGAALASKKQGMAAGPVMQCLRHGVAAHKA